MAVRSKITIFNAALLRTGNHAATAGDGSFISQALEANYDEIVREAFESAEFPFGKARTALTTRAAGRFGYDDAYLMDSDVIHVIEIYLNGYEASDTHAKWEIDAETNELLVSAGTQTVEIKYLKVGLEHTWSATFTRGIQRKLEAVVKDVIEEVEEAAALDNEGDFQILKGSVKAGKNRSERRVFKKYGGRLIRAHRTRRR